MQVCCCYPFTCCTPVNVLAHCTSYACWPSCLHFGHRLSQVDLEETRDQFIARFSEEPKREDLTLLNPKQEDPTDQVHMHFSVLAHRNRRLHLICKMHSCLGFRALHELHKAKQRAKRNIPRALKLAWSCCRCLYSTHWRTKLA